MQRIDVTLTIDIRVCDTIVSHLLFKRMSEVQRLQLLKVCPRGSAGREPLRSYGKVVIEIWMGTLCFNHICVVVDVVDEDLLLYDSSCLANIIQPEEKMMFRGATILLKMVRSSIVRHVTVAESFEVPTMEEVIVDAYVDRCENQEGKEKSRLLVEMYPNLPEGYNCVLAASKMDTAISTMVPVHVFNPHSYPMAIRQDSVVGQVEPVEVVSTILRCKNHNERIISQ